MSKIFQATAEGDQLFFGADTVEQAEKKFIEMMGPVPRGLVTWREVAELPEGEELL